ncbi:MAG TPA: DegV family protein, partial [Mycobacterium sp.]|nr:DegV family protein [Mycobacterium sp.]
MAVVVVTDSSARLPAAETHRWDIRVAPLHVLVDGHDLCDGVDDVPADLYTRGHVTTAGATPAELSALYRQAVLDSG